MSMENAILIGFAGCTLVSGILLLRFFKRQNARPKRPPTWRSWTAGNALVLFFLISLLLAGGECYYRFFNDTTDAYMFTKVSRHWLRRHDRTNGTGVRDSIEYHWARAPGKRRITFLGDSFTVGHGVRDVEARFANRIRQRQPGWEIHVLAINGWETGNELALLESELRDDYEFDTVVLVYMLNDISDLSPDYFLRAVRRIAPRGPLKSILNESYFLNAWYYRLRTAGDPDLGNY